MGGLVNSRGHRPAARPGPTSLRLLFLASHQYGSIDRRDRSFVIDDTSRQLLVFEPPGIGDEVYLSRHGFNRHRETVNTQGRSKAKTRQIQGKYKANTRSMQARVRNKKGLAGKVLEGAVRSGNLPLVSQFFWAWIGRAPWGSGNRGKVQHGWLSWSILPLASNSCSTPFR